MSRWKSVLTGALMASFAVAGTGVARADSVADFYHGKTINLEIGYSVGGAYDMYARLLARYMGNHIPGNPTIVPQNMPGAGSLKAATYIYSMAPKDGLTIGTFGRTMMVEPLLGAGHFDARKYTWLGSMDSDVALCITWKTSKVKDFADLTTIPSRFAGQGAGSDPDVGVQVLTHLFNAKTQLVSGYPGSNEGDLAMERGEVDGECGVSWSTMLLMHRDWMKAKDINYVAQLALEKHPALPNVPLLQDETTNPEAKEILNLIAASQAIARPFVAPPDIPADRAAALQKAFADTLQDPAFLAEAKKLRAEIRYVSPAQIQPILNDAYKASPDLIAKAKDAVGGSM